MSFTMTSKDYVAYINIAAKKINENGEYISKLDSTTGDGDHWANINMGFENLVAAGLGCSFAAFAAFGVNTYRDDLCYFSIGDPPLHWNLAVAYHKKHPPSLQAQKLIQAIHELILR